MYICGYWWEYLCKPWLLGNITESRLYTHKNYTYQPEFDWNIYDFFSIVSVSLCETLNLSLLVFYDHSYSRFSLFCCYLVILNSDEFFRLFGALCQIRARCLATENKPESYIHNAVTVHFPKYRHIFYYVGEIPLLHVCHSIIVFHNTDLQKLWSNNNVGPDIS